MSIDKKISRIINILLCVGTNSPSMGRRVKVSDIWKTPSYMGCGNAEKKINLSGAMRRKEKSNERY